MIKKKGFYYDKEMIGIENVTIITKVLSQQEPLYYKHWPTVLWRLSLPWPQLCKPYNTIITWSLRFIIHVSVKTPRQREDREREEKTGKMYSARYFNGDGIKQTSKFIMYSDKAICMFCEHLCGGESWNYLLNVFSLDYFKMPQGILIC